MTKRQERDRDAAWRKVLRLGDRLKFHHEEYKRLTWKIVDAVRIAKKRETPQ